MSTCPKCGSDEITVRRCPGRGSCGERLGYHPAHVERICEGCRTPVREATTMLEGSAGVSDQLAIKERNPVYSRAEEQFGRHSVALEKDCACEPCSLFVLLATAEHQRDKALTTLDDSKKMMAAANRAGAQILDRLHGLEAALRKYGHHTNNCSVSNPSPCNCGFDAACAAFTIPPVADSGVTVKRLHMGTHTGHNPLKTGG